MTGARTSGDAAIPGHLSQRSIAGLLFTAEMYGVQRDQLSAVLGVSEARAGAIVRGWQRAGYAASGRIGPGGPWIWLTRAGLAACGLRYPATAPALSRLAHLRAVSAVRLALESVPDYRSAGAFWRSERRLRARLGGAAGLRQHVPDGEVHWPDATAAGWAGECWAIEAELTRKTLARTAAIMREILTRTADYGHPPGQAWIPGAAPRHARVIYLCSPAARPTVARARDMLGPLGTRVEIRDLPPGALLPGPAATNAPPGPGTGAAVPPRRGACPPPGGRVP